MCAYMTPRVSPVKDEVSVQHEKVAELRGLSEWSEAQFWCSPEQHGNITAVMKNQSRLLAIEEGKEAEEREVKGSYRELGLELAQEHLDQEQRIPLLIY